MKVGQDLRVSRGEISLRRGRAKAAIGIYSFASVMLVLNSLGLDQASAFLSLKAANICSLSACLSDGEISATTFETDQQLRLKLESMTIKELRDVLKASPDLNKRGILSRLKLKKDIVEYLRDNLRSSRLEDRKVMERKTRTSPLSMPATNGKFQASLSARDASFERTYQQYPPLRDVGYCSGIGEDDVRQKCHPIFEGEQSQMTGDMDIVFVGTASCTPGVSRGVSCTALRLNWNRHVIHGVPGAVEESVQEFNGGTWLFDAGECTQLQVQRTVSIKPGKINKIFLTHAHGDHSFGLPGLLCLMGQDRDRHSSAPVDIYGPEGLRMWLRVAIRYSISRIVPNYRVHELKDIPVAPEWEFNRRSNRYVYRGLNNRTDIRWGYQGLAGEDRTSWISQADKMNLQPSRLFGEVEGGCDIYPTYDHPHSSDGAPVWEVEVNDDVKVFAAPMSHSVPCVGYVIEEKSKPGRLRSELVTPIVQRNLNALKEAGFAVPMKVLGVIKNLPAGSSFTFPDGTVVTEQEAVEPPKQGRKVVICGDTASARAIEGLAMGADVVIHEATNSFLPGVDKDSDLQTVTRDAIVHGHSTPYMAGQFAKRIQAKRLVMNHFSARYKGDPSVESLSIMTRLENQAVVASGFHPRNVAAAWDFMVLPIRSIKGTGE